MCSMKAEVRENRKGILYMEDWITKMDKLKGGVRL